MILGIILIASIIPVFLLVAYSIYLIEDKIERIAKKSGYDISKDGEIV